MQVLHQNWRSLRPNLVPPAISKLCVNLPPNRTTRPNWPIKLPGWPSSLRSHDGGVLREKLLPVPGSCLVSRQPRFAAKHLDLGLHAIPPPVCIFSTQLSLTDCVDPYPKALNQKHCFCPDTRGFKGSKLTVWIALREVTSPSSNLSKIYSCIWFCCYSIACLNNSMASSFHMMQPSHGQSSEVSE